MILQTAENHHLVQQAFRNPDVHDVLIEGLYEEVMRRALALYKLRIPPSFPIASLSSRHSSSIAQRTNFNELDAKWQDRWARAPGAMQNCKKPKSYILPMFAYPSGSLHMGHLRVYTISDVVARYKRMKGYHVLHPTGWDAFGLPAENAAIERGLDPSDWTVSNIEKMKTQLKSMNTNFDWDAEISTCSPTFYKHTQALFNIMLEKGYVYRKEASVNWDPVDKTVLANEQVDNHGRSWRSGALVEQRTLKQWFFAITKLQQDLLRDLDTLSKDNLWPERVVQQQRNWIGRSEGAQIQFDIQFAHEVRQVNVFTTRPETLFGVKYIALSLSHPVVQVLSTESAELRDFLERRESFGQNSKEGFELPLKAKNPATLLNPVPFPSVPVFVAPYVLDEYGHGAVMGVPAHDARDLAFWKLHRPKDEIPIVVAKNGDEQNPLRIATEMDEAYIGDGFLSTLCGPYTGMAVAEAGRKIVQDLAGHGKAKAESSWRLRDWLVSRQRYWGTPIPVIHCPSCGEVPVPAKDLPVKLPKLDRSVKSLPGNPLEHHKNWINTECPSCGGQAKRETDTMDTFVDSSWYYLRFPDPTNKDLFSKHTLETMLPVDTYIGGVEHAILHLLYARFVYKFLCSSDVYNDCRTPHEPFKQLIAQGMVHGRTFTDPDSGRFLKPDEVDHSSDEPKIISSGKKPNMSYEKMSKSKHNGVDPTICISKYGADATRAHILFAAPVSEVLQWDEDKIVGIQRWFQRIGTVVNRLKGVNLVCMSRDINTTTEQDVDILLLAQATVHSTSDTFERNIYGLNTYISDLIKLTNAIHDKDMSKLSPWVSWISIETLIKMLAPVAPAFAEECWEEMQQMSRVGQSDANVSIFETQWPTSIVNSQEEEQLKLTKASMTCAVQINGKLRFTTQIPAQNTTSVEEELQSRQREQAIISALLAIPEGRLWLTEKNDWNKRKKIVVVRGGRLVNVVF